MTLSHESLSVLKFSRHHWGPDVESDREEEIVAVCGHTELYDAASYLYRNQTKKQIAWRKVSEEVGLPGKFWKYVCYLIPAIGCTFWSGLHLENKHFKSCFGCGVVHTPDKARLFTNQHGDVIILTLFWSIYCNYITTKSVQKCDLKLPLTGDREVNIRGLFECK